MTTADTNEAIGRMGDKKPRVHFKYPIKTDGATKLVELPFIIGVMAGLSGNAKKGLPDVAERKFKKLVKGKLDSFLNDVSPELEFEVPNRLSGNKDETVKIRLTMRKMKDFDPASLVEQVPMLKELMDERRSLQEILQCLGSREVQQKVLSWMQNEQRRTALLTELKPEGK